MFCGLNPPRPMRHAGGRGRLHEIANFVSISTQPEPTWPGWFWEALLSLHTHCESGKPHMRCHLDWLYRASRNSSWRARCICSVSLFFVGAIRRTFEQQSAEQELLGGLLEKPREQLLNEGEGEGKGDQEEALGHPDSTGGYIRKGVTRFNPEMPSAGADCRVEGLENTSHCGGRGRWRPTHPHIKEQASQMAHLAPTCNLKDMTSSEGRVKP